MIGKSRACERPAVWVLFLGVILGVVVSKLMDGWPQASADGEQTPARKQFTEQAEIFRQAAKQIAPAVVAITTMKKVMQVEGFTVERGPDFRGIPRFYRKPKLKEGLQIAGAGSGFVFDAQNGYVLTNNHVVAGGEEWVVRLSDKREASAKLVGADPQTDVAVLKIQAEDLTAAPLGDSEKVEVGDWVLAVGNPFGWLEQTVTAGIVSAKGRRGLGLSNYEDFLQTDAAINRGNSGGPLVNLNGQVIGINSAIVSESGGYQGIGFAIPINQARKVAQKLIRDGQVVRGWMGVEFEELTPAQATRQGLGDHGRLLVKGVYLRGPAQQAGVLLEDVILKVNGKDIQSGGDLRDIIADLEPGTSIDLKVQRKGKPQDVKLTLGRQPKDLNAARDDPRD